MPAGWHGVTATANRLAATSCHAGRLEGFPPPVLSASLAKPQSPLPVKLRGSHRSEIA